jgi:hypothetical protein
MLILDLLNYAWRMGFMPFIGVGGSQNYEIQKSLRFRASASAYLSRTPSGSGDRQTWTWSGWVKRGALQGVTLFSASNSTNTNYSQIVFSASTDTLDFLGAFVSSSVTARITTSAVFRDPAAWYHVVAVFDTTNATSTDRLRLYVNGVRQTAASGTYPAINYASGLLNSTFVHRIGAINTGSLINEFDGHMAEINFVDGQALDPSQFGKTDSTTGAWVPKRYAGSYGTNGFYLPFSDGTSLTTLGNDESGNNNDWTLNNVSLTAGTTYDWMDDTPTNNFATLNPIAVSAEREGTIADANLGVTQNTSTVGAVYSFSTIALHPSAKVYVEATAVSGITSAASGLATCGVVALDNGSAITNVLQYVSDARKFVDGSISAYGATYASNDVIGMAIDMASKSVEFFKNNVSQGVLNWAGTYSTLYVSVSANGNTSGNRVWATNFGQRPFAYTPPSGFKTLCTKNLPAPRVKRGDNYFDANTRTGTGAAFSVTGKRFSPDLVWTKSRSAATDHAIYDSVRGATKQLESNTTTPETTEANGLTAFNSDGFSGGALAQINTNGATYVDWMWKESIASGLDIVTYTGTGANRTIAHGLGVVPKVILVRSRTGANREWAVYHAENTSAPETDYLLLSSNAATADLNTYWNDTAPTSSVFSLGTINTVNANGEDYVAYLFAEVDGFSKFGSYIGNASVDGPFIWCGFRPKAVIFKCTTTGALSWIMEDTARSDGNVVQKYFSADLNVAESDSSVGAVDFLSNGFKLRTTNGNWNNSGGTYVFLAFAETPFKYANAR